MTHLKALLEKDVMQDVEEVVNTHSALDHALDLAVGRLDRRACHAVEHHLADKKAANHQGEQLLKRAIEVISVNLLTTSQCNHVLDVAIDLRLSPCLEKIEKSFPHQLLVVLCCSPDHTHHDMPRTNLMHAILALSHLKNRFAHLDASIRADPVKLIEKINSNLI